MSMPSRMLRESICYSETLDTLSAPAERLFYRLLTQADDYGRFDARPSVVRSRCFQLGAVKDADAGEWLAQLVRAGVVCTYTVEGRAYGHFPTWAKYQRIRSPRSRYPDPPQVAAGCGELPQVAADCGSRARASGSGSGVGVEDGVVLRKLRRRADKAAPLPPDFSFTDDRRRFAEAGGVPDPGLEFAQFKDHHRAKGSLMYDWEAAWKTWCRNAVKYATQRQQRR
jgi:hypothetical protein